jgi:hypothetical protein
MAATFPTPQATKTVLRAFGTVLLTQWVCLSGCTEVTVENDGKIATALSFGVRRINVDRPQSPTVVETKGFGAIAGTDHVVVGWLDEATVIFPDPARCALLIFAEHHDDVKSVVDILESAGAPLRSICIASRRDR